MFSAVLSALLALSAAPIARQDPAPAPAPVAGTDKTDKQDEKELEAAKPSPADVAADALAAEYEKAVVDWRERRGAAREAKQAFKEPAPIVEFYARFGKLAQEDNGRALFWMADHVQELPELSLKNVGPSKKELMQKLVRAHANHPWSFEIVDLVGRQKRWFERPELVALLDEFVEHAKAHEHIGRALERIASLLDGPKATPEDKQRIESLRARIEKEFPAAARPSGGAVEAPLSKEDEEYLKKNLSPGSTAMEIEAKDVEGVAFKLSDYKGKVVLLDFWGFW